MRVYLLFLLFPLSSFASFTQLEWDNNQKCYQVSPSQIKFKQRNQKKAIRHFTTTVKKLNLSPPFYYTIKKHKEIEKRIGPYLSDDEKYLCHKDNPEKISHLIVLQGFQQINADEFLKNKNLMLITLFHEYFHFFLKNIHPPQSWKILYKAIAWSALMGRGSYLLGADHLLPFNEGLPIFIEAFYTHKFKLNIKKYYNDWLKPQITLEQLFVDELTIKQKSKFSLQEIIKRNALVIDQASLTTKHISKDLYNQEIPFYKENIRELSPQELLRNEIAVAHLFYKSLKCYSGFKLANLLKDIQRLQPVHLLEYLDMTKKRNCLIRKYSVFKNILKNRDMIQKEIDRYFKLPI